MKNRYLIIIMLLLGFYKTLAQQNAPIIEWQKSLGGSSSDLAWDIIPIDAGSYVIGGSTTSSNGDVHGGHGLTDMWVVKLSAQGDTLWTKCYGQGGGDLLVSLKSTLDGGFILAGGTTANNGDAPGNHDPSGFTKDILIIKIDSAGNELWKKWIGGSKDDAVSAIAPTADGGYIVCGKTKSFDGDVVNNPTPNSDLYCWMFKLDESGDFLWQTFIGGTTGGTIINDIHQTPDGGYIAAGSTGANDGDVSGNHGGADVWVAKLSASGNITWQKCLGGSDSEFSESITSTIDGGYIIAAKTNSNNGDVTGNIYATVLFSDFWIVKITASGTIQWQKSYGGSFNDWAHSIIQTNDGNYAVTGYTSSNNGDVIGRRGGTDYWVIKLDTAGTLLWQKCLGGTNNEEAKSIVETPDGGYAVAGYSRSNNFDVTGNHGNFDFWVVKLRLENTLEFYTTTNSSDTLLLNSSTSLFQNSFKICADGSSATIFKFECDTCVMSRLKYKIQSSSIANDGLVSGYFSNETVNGNILEGVLTHPAYLDPGYLSFRHDTLLIVDTVLEAEVFKNPLEVYRAPIVFIHGFTGSGTTFEKMSTQLINEQLYPAYEGSINTSPLIYMADFFSTSMELFFVNRKQVPNAITQVFYQLKQGKFSAGKVTLVCHSMGGLLSRLYLQGAWNGIYKNDIQKLITLNTPHYGTQIANYLLHSNSFIASTVIEEFLNPFDDPLQLGALYDMQVNSKSIKYRVNKPLAEQGNFVPSTTLSSDQFLDLSLEGKILRALLRPEIDKWNLFDNDHHDFFVPIASQRSNLNFSSAPTVNNQIHTSTKNATIYNQVKYLIDAPPTSSDFSLQGFPPDLLLPPVFFENRAVDDSIEIATPSPGTIYNSGDMLTVTFTHSDTITRIVLLLSGSSINPIIIDTTAVSEISILLPPHCTGTINLLLLGGDSTSWFCEDTTYILVQSIEVPDSIISYPRERFVAVGLTQKIDVNGFFGTDAVILNGSNDLTFEYDSTLLLYKGDFIFQARVPASADITFTYAGLTTTTILETFDDPTYLAAGFNYSNDQICEGDSIIFNDRSQGNAISYQWHFPGGSPPTSTLVNPVVTYALPGTFPVTLITTFENGVDSITLEDLITVGCNPSDSFSLEIKVLIEGYYQTTETMVPLLYNSSLNSSSTATDSVTVQLFDPIQPTEMFFSSSGIVSHDGTLLINIPASYYGRSCYVAIVHRNSITTWSKVPITLGTVSSIDFRH